MINDQTSIRTLDDVKKEYAQICSSAGEMQYMIKEFEAKLDITNQKLLELKHEYQSLERLSQNKASDDETLPFNKQIAP